MTFLPVVERELRVASRRRGTYWSRFQTVLVVLGVCCWVWLEAGAATPAHERGRRLFIAISGLAFLVGYLSGITVTSDSLSEEKREGTLGLLFLTDLKGYDVVLGKLAATSITVFYRLLAILPVLGIPFLMGGLSLDEFARMALVLANVMFCSLAAGILLSSLCRQERFAMGCTFALLMILAVAGPCAGLGALIKSPGAMVPRGYFMPSPGFAYFLCLEPAFRVVARDFWMNTAITHALGWLFLLGASVVVPRSWQDRPEGNLRAAWAQWLREFRHGGPAQRSVLRTRLLDVNPILWLNGRDRSRRLGVFCFLVATGAGWMWIYLRSQSAMLDPIVYMITAYFLHTGLKFWVANESSRTFAEARQSGALELLLSTPLTVRQILQGQLLGLSRQFGWSVLIVLAVDGVMLWAGLVDRFAGSSDQWPTLFISIVAVFIADLGALALVGMWLGLTAKGSGRAATGALGRILFLPWVLFLMLTTVMAVMGGVWFESHAESFLLPSAVIIALATDAVFGLRAWVRLNGQFREASAARFERKATVAATREQTRLSM